MIHKRKGKLKRDNIFLIWLSKCFSFFNKTAFVCTFLQLRHHAQNNKPYKSHMITLPKILCRLIVLLQVKNRSLQKHGVAGITVNSKAGLPWRSTTLLSQYVFVNMASAKVYLRKKILVHAFFDADFGGHTRHANKSLR